MTYRMTSRPNARHLSLSIVALLLFGLPIAQDSPYADGSFTRVGETLDTLIDIRALFDPYSEELQVSATLMDGPFAGTVVRGWAPVGWEGSLAERALVTAFSDPINERIALIAVIPDVDGWRGVRLRGFVASELSSAR